MNISKLKQFEKIKLKTTAEGRIREGFFLFRKRLNGQIEPMNHVYIPDYTSILGPNSSGIVPLSDSELKQRMEGAKNR